MIIESSSAVLDRNMIERVCVGDMTTRGAAQFADKPALISPERILTYRELNEQANRLGRALLALGLKHQEAVGVMAGNCVELMIVYFACAKAGLICSPVNLGLRVEEIAYCLDKADVRVLIVQDKLFDAARKLSGFLPKLEKIYWTGDIAPEGLAKDAGSLDALIDNVSPQELEVVVQDRDNVQLLYTSGTTASPKGVLTSHVAVTMASLSAAVSNQLTTNTVGLIVLPLFHCGMLNAVALPILAVGATVLIRQGFEGPQTLMGLIEHHRSPTSSH